MEEEEKHTFHVLAQWDKDLRIIEDWLENPGTKEYC